MSGVDAPQSFIGRNGDEVMSTQPHKPQKSLLVDIILIGVFILGLALVIVAAREIVNDSALATGAVTIEARVTEMRVMTSRRSGESYEVRYAFQAGGQTYTYKDETGRTNLWATISQKAWEAARQKRTVEVAYLPADPWVNHAVARPSDRLFGYIAGLVVGLICMLPALLWGVSAFRRSRRAPNPSR
jgi:uncharacterized protein DUF3592